jgi:Fe-S cluster assembly ATP-binding protein
MLEIQGLSVNIGDRPVLRNVDLKIQKGETVALFGPNGSGKTSLLHTIIGMPGYIVLSGRILYKDEDVTGMPLDVRARLGIGVAFQRPPAVRGVKLADLVRTLHGKNPVPDGHDWNHYIGKLLLEGFEGRDVNLGFSGGEIKRSELLQLLAQAPDLILLDEPDSGVDLVSIKIIGEFINVLLEKEKSLHRRDHAGLIITHGGHILDQVNIDRAYVMIRGEILCTGNPRDLLEDIRCRGYEGCVKCLN